MNSLNERLKRLEQITTTHGFEQESSSPIDIPISGSASRKKRPIRLESVQMNSIDLEGHLQERIELEKRQHRSQELAKLQEHFFEGALNAGSSICRKIQFAVEYTEVNASKIAHLMGTVSSGDFKRTLCVSLVASLTDVGEQLLVDIIETIVDLRYPKKVVKVDLSEPEPEAFPEPPEAKKKSGFFKKK